MANYIQKLAQYFSKSQKKLREAKKIIPLIQMKEDYYMNLSNNQLIEKTQEFKDLVQSGTSLMKILPDAFALFREAAKRYLYQRPYDVQMLGAYILNQGMIAEMYTGEGKTLVAGIAAFLNALEGKGVYVVSVNDYLSRRDSEEIGKILRGLGLTVGLIQENMSNHERKRQYACDVTYVSNHEIAFDYLRDNMENSLENQVIVNRMNYCIVDEADSIFLDEGKTPLIISGAGSQSSDLYERLTPIVKKLDEKIHLEFDEFKTNANLTELGMDFIEEELYKAEIIHDHKFNIINEETNDNLHNNEEKQENLKNNLNSTDNENLNFLEKEEKKNDSTELIKEEENLEKNNIPQPYQYFNRKHSLYEAKNLLIVHYINQIIKANFIMKKDIDYIVSKSDEIIIIDQNTGRLSVGRRFSDGLHQALEAKEGVEVKDESVVLATTTYQSFFRLFTKLSGMSGTAKEDEEELEDVYRLEVVSIPTNRPSKKIVKKDRLFFKKEQRLAAACQIAKELQERGQPGLFITLSVNESEILSKELTKNKVKHELLNAKNHEQEAEIIRNAGRFGMITVATDIAGRGTDIQLGGSKSYLISVCQEQGMSELQIEEKIQELEKEKLIISELGGLFVHCSGRHEMKRLDNQASGRCGRQGEPGCVRFDVCLEDELFQNSMGNSALQQWSLSQILESGEEYLEGDLVESLVNNIQNSKALANYEIRKNLFRYDKIVDIQRKIVYQIRNNLLSLPIVYENFNKIDGIINKSPILQLGKQIFTNITEKIIGSVDYNHKETLIDAYEKLSNLFNIPYNNEEYIIDNKGENLLSEKNAFFLKLKNIYESTIENMNKNESVIEISSNIKLKLISTCDNAIQKYLQSISDGKDGSYLSSYAQKDPVNEFNNRMMGILGDLFLEWQKLFVQSICNNDYEYSMEAKEQNIDNSFKYIMSKLGEDLKNKNSGINDNNGINDIKNEEQERMQLKNEIYDIMMEHLNEDTIQYYESSNDTDEENNDDNKQNFDTDQLDKANLITKENIQETIEFLADKMDVEQLKNLKEELLVKIKDVQANEISVENSAEYQDVVAQELEEVENVEDIIEEIQKLANDYSKEEWNEIQNNLINEIKNILSNELEILEDESNEYIFSNIDEENYNEDVQDIIEDIEDLMENIEEEEEWNFLRDHIIERIKTIYPQSIVKVTIEKNEKEEDNNEEKDDPSNKN